MIADPLPWCELVDLRLEAAVSPGRPLRWGPLPPGEEDDSRLDYGRVFGPWDVPDGPPQDDLWVDLSESMTEVQWTGGTQDSDTVFPRWEAAQLRAVFHDPDLLLDPTNYLSPLNRRTVPNTPVRLRGAFRDPPSLHTIPAETPGRYWAVTAGPGVPDDPALELVVDVLLSTPDQSGVDTVRELVTGSARLRLLNEGTQQATIQAGLLQADGSWTDLTADNYQVPADRPVWYRIRYFTDQGTQHLQLWTRAWYASGTPTGTPPNLDWVLLAEAAANDDHEWSPATFTLSSFVTADAQIDCQIHEIDASLEPGHWQLTLDRRDLRDRNPAATVLTCSTGQVFTLDPAHGEIQPTLPGHTFATLFGGYADTWAPQWAADSDDRFTQLTATDGVKILAAFDTNATNPVGNGETASERVTRILDHALWPSDQRNITPGGVPLIGTNHAQPAWTELLLAADSDLGYVYLAPDGRLTYVPGEVVRDRLGDDAVVAFGCDGWDIITEATAGFDIARLRNIVSGQVGNRLRTDANEASIARYRAKSYKRTDLLQQTAADLEDWVSFVLLIGSEPRRNIVQIRMEPTLEPQSFRWLLIPDFLEAWDISWTPPGDGTSHTVREKVTVGGWVHSVTPDRWETVVSTGIIAPFATQLRQWQQKRKGADIA